MGNQSDLDPRAGATVAAALLDPVPAFADLDDVERCALLQGRSDGRQGYHSDPGDFTGRARALYLSEFRSARADLVRGDHA